ncbi:hypothetical protein KIW84_070484 [Lathyrus oleraceus]|uniref:Ubiquitin-like protease family profile domain-containing protein n=1 Tax=Pisum sativum TaxID=3888 RepID=A0A9D4VG68_PEA|nr:hypothetical protein KIW84_070484 [Pisum sativum]
MREMEDKMASNQDDTHDASGSRNNVENEIKRGLTVMKSIIRARDKGEKFEVHWSAEDQLIEPNGSMLASYIGFLVRQHIPITCDNWRSPELKVGKEKIWSEIQRSFHIDESRQKYCIQLAGKRLRGFRSFLSNKFLKDEEGKFEVSDKNRKRASTPAYPYKKGLTGYARYMYDTLMRGTELCNRFNFIAASRINTTFITKNPTSVMNELVDRFMVAGDNTTPSLYFLPFNSGNGGHWVLVAMDLSRLMVYYLDSLPGDWSKYPSMKKTLDAAILKFRSKKNYRNRKDITWVRVQYFDEYKSYSRAHLDEMKDELCQFIIDHRII